MTFHGIEDVLRASLQTDAPIEGPPDLHLIMNCQHEDKKILRPVLPSPSTRSTAAALFCCVFFQQTREERARLQDALESGEGFSSCSTSLQLNGGGVLHSAVLYGSVRLAEWVARVPSDMSVLNAKDDDGATPLSLAASTLEAILRRFAAGEYDLNEMHSTRLLGARCVAESLASFPFVSV